MNPPLSRDYKVNAADDAFSHWKCEVLLGSLCSILNSDASSNLPLEFAFTFAHHGSRYAWLYRTTECRRSVTQLLVLD